MSRSVLILGGARSGKSNYARMLATAASRPVVFVATAQHPQAGAPDDDFARRIARHRRDRPTDWPTLDAPVELAAAVRHAWTLATVVLVDELGVWAANRLLAASPEAELPPERLDALEQTLCDEVAQLIATTPAEGLLLLVSPEVGWGVHPATALGRRFRDLLGRVNQRAAALSSEVYLLVAGLPLDLRQRSGSQPAPWPNADDSEQASAGW